MADIQGKIIWAGERRGGVSAQSGKSWATQDFAIENQYTDPSGRTVITRIQFAVFGEDKLNEYQLAVGAEVKVSYTINAREYQGKWYNDVRAYKVERLTSPNPSQGGVYVGTGSNQNYGQAMGAAPVQGTPQQAYLQASRSWHTDTQQPQPQYGDPFAGSNNNPPF